MSSEREEAIKIYCLAENELIRLSKEKWDLEKKIEELREKLPRLHDLGDVA
ncbi:hypothetical protein LCGC14_0471520 [marine sediment metagenome]|uniref:Uncharacterized protein n=1 Tax=marine sediment metagenome TaxID=412755 RepID=A0A0F9SC38_9ZZZZ|nr:MAG: hypothetical protein Lokiarch_25490 [Candidatus Lokiarchaeum sp. GC14_75]